MTDSATEQTARQLARLAQTCLAQPVPLAATDLVIHCYRAYPELAVLDELQQRYEQGRPLPEYDAQSWLAFIVSKPHLADSTVTLHSLCVLDQQGKPTGEYWLKLKSSQAIAAHFNAVTQCDTPAVQCQQSILQQSALPHSPPLQLSQQWLDDGPQWLKTPIVKADNGTVALPTVITPLDVAERFAGHCYLKLLSAEHPFCR